MNTNNHTLREVDRHVAVAVKGIPQVYVIRAKVR